MLNLYLFPRGRHEKVEVIVHGTTQAVAIGKFVFILLSNRWGVDKILK
jgi:hypothetical protein